MTPFQTLPPVTLWLTFHRQHKGRIGNLTRFVEPEETGPGWQDRHGLESYLPDQNLALLPTLAEAWTECESAIIEGWEY